MSFPTHRSYKHTNAGWVDCIPSHWEMHQARRIFSQRREDALVTDEQLSATQKYGVIPQRMYMEQEDQKVVLALSGIGNFRHVEADDFVISLRSFQGGIERSRYFGCVSPAYTVLKPKAGLVAGYWEYLLKAAPYISALQTMTDGIREGKNISYQQFGALLVPFPPSDEQSSVAAFLDKEIAKIDALVEEQNRLIELLKEKRQAVISQAVTKGLDPNVPMKDSGVEWLGEVPAHWGHARKLVDLAANERHSFVNGPFGSDLLTGELTDEGVPVVYIRDIKPQGYQRVSEWHVTAEKAKQLGFCNVISGDIVIAKVGDPPGLAAIYPDKEPDGIVTQDVIRLRLDRSKAVPSYIRWLLNSRYGQTMIDDISVESTRTRVGLGEYKQLRFFVPPLQEQEELARHIGGFVVGIDRLVSEASLAATVLQERRSALISAAVTGKIDVRGLVPPCEEV